VAYRRKIIDRRTREGKALGKQLDALKGFGILALIVCYFVFGRGQSDKSSSDATDSLVAPAQAASMQSPTTSLPTASRPQANGYVASGLPASSGPVTAPTAYAMNALPSPNLASGIDTAPARQSVPWRHVTATGVRWSLRNVSATSMLLIVDLGGDQVANVSVAPAFENLDMAGMNDRVDHVRSVIGQYFPLQTANYSFDRDGALRPMR
jgi:hypothetical protein